MAPKSRLSRGHGGGLCALWGWGLIYWTPTFLQRAYNLNVGEGRRVTGDIHSGAVRSRPSNGVAVLSRPFMARPAPRSYGCLPEYWPRDDPFLIAHWTHSLWVCKLMFCIFIPAIYFYIGPCFGLLNNLAPCHMRNMFIAGVLLVAIYSISWWRHGVGRGLERLVRRAHMRTPHRCDRRCWSWLPPGFWAAYHLYMASKTIIADQKRAIGYTKSWAP